MCIGHVKAKDNFPNSIQIYHTEFYMSSSAACETTKPLLVTLEISECSRFYSVRSLSVHGFVSWLQHGKYGSTASRHSFKGKSATYCAVIIHIACPACLLEFPSCIYAYPILAARRCERIQNYMYYRN